MKSAKFWFGALLLVGIFLGFLFGYLLLNGDGITSGQKTAGVRYLPPTVGAPVPDFELTGLDGTSRTLSSFQGRPVVINFWATWCPPCKEEMPLFERYSREYAGELVILGVDSEEKATVVRPFVAKMDITFPILLDEAGLVSNSYFVKDFPYTFFVDESGILRGQHIGLLTEEKFVQYLGTIGIEP